jgi:predicted phage terminase large subunit-like protein
MNDKNSELTRTQQLLALARGDLACYVAALWPQFLFAPHLNLIISKLEAVERGEITRLMIFMPPRHGKSLIASTIYPAWYLGRNPNRSVIFASYGQALSDDYGRQVRNLLADPLHQAIFSACRLSEDSAAAHRFNTTEGGAYFAVGRGGPVTGRGADLLILDDLLKGWSEANSETVRHDVHNWYLSDAYTRLAPGGRVVLIGTRWHQDDLAGRLLASSSGEHWDVLSLPAIAEEDESFRRKGEALWPERYPLSVLEKSRAESERVFVCLYQQRPTAVEGAIFKRDWWQFYRPPVVGPFIRITQSWDTAFKTGEENDYSVCTTWGVTENAFILLHLCRVKVEFPELKRIMTSLAEQWNPHEILIEDCGSGPSIIQELRSSTRLPIKPVRPYGDKQSRAHAVTPAIQGGQAFLPETASWLPDFLDEMSSFPDGLHDDIVDSTSQALNYLRQTKSVLMTDATIRNMLGISDSEEVDDKEELWERAMQGGVITPEEMDRM